MSDKLNEMENVTPETEETAVEEVEEVVEEATEEIEETVEETADEIVEETENLDEVVSDEIEETAEDDVDAVDEFAEGVDNTEETVEEEIEAPKKSKAPVIAIVAVVIVVAAIVAIALSVFGGNKYESDDYPPISGLTIADVADQMGIGVAEFLAAYELPADMPETTSQEAAFYLVPAKKFAEMNGLDFATLMSELNIPAETSVSEPKGILEKIVRFFAPEKPQPITEETPWGVVLGELTIANYVGEENIEEFKKFYELDETVTGETKYKEVRDAINEKTIKLMEEQELLEETPADTPEEDAEAPAETTEEPEQTPADTAE